MTSPDDLIDAAHRNFIASYRTLARNGDRGDVREASGVFAFVTGLPLALFNGCIVTGPSTAAEIDDAVRWVHRHDVPYRVWVGPTSGEGHADVLAGHGLIADPESLPGMVLHPLPSPSTDPPGVTVTSVDPTDRAALGEHLDTWVALGLPLEIVVGIISPAMAADPDVRLFTGRLDGRPVATSVAIRSGDVSGIYGVGTHETARRRGVGTAVTWAAADAGRVWGCDTVVLQASDMGLPVYERMGFRTVVSYAMYGQHRPRTVAVDQG